MGKEEKKVQGGCESGSRTRRERLSNIRKCRGADKSLARPGRKWLSNITRCRGADKSLARPGRKWLSNIRRCRGADKSVARPGRKWISNIRRCRGADKSLARPTCLSVVFKSFWEPKMFTIMRDCGYKCGGIYGNTIKTGGWVHSLTSFYCITIYTTTFIPIVYYCKSFGIPKMCTAT
jgi:hypothetical protein